MHYIQLNKVGSNPQEEYQKSKPQCKEISFIFQFTLTCIELITLALSLHLLHDNHKLWSSQLKQFHQYRELEKLEDFFRRMYEFDLEIIKSNFTSVQSNITSIHSEQAVIQNNLTTIYQSINLTNSNITQIQTEIQEIKNYIASQTEVIQSIRINILNIERNIKTNINSIYKIDLKIENIDKSIININGAIELSNINLMNINQAIEYTNNNITSIKSDIIQINNNINLLSQNLTFIHSNTSELYLQISKANDTLGFHSTELNRIEKNQGILFNDMKININEFDVKMTSQISNLKSNLSQIQTTTIPNLQTEIDILQTNVTSFSQKLTLQMEIVNNSSIPQLNSLVSDLQSQILKNAISIRYYGPFHSPQHWNSVNTDGIRFSILETSQSCVITVAQTSFITLTGAGHTKCLECQAQGIFLMNGQRTLDWSTEGFWTFGGFYIREYWLPMNFSQTFVVAPGSYLFQIGVISNSGNIVYLNAMSFTAFVINMPIN